MTLYEDGNPSLGYYFISEYLKKKDVKEVNKIVDVYVEKMIKLEEQMEEVKQSFFLDLEDKGFENRMGVITYKTIED